MRLLLVTNSDEDAEVNAVVMRCLRLADRAVALMLRIDAIETVELWLAGNPTSPSASEVGRKLRRILDVLGETIERHAQRGEIIDHVRWWAGKLRSDLDQATS